MRSFLKTYSPRPVESSDEDPVMDSFPLERILESVDQIEWTFSTQLFEPY